MTQELSLPNAEDLSEALRTSEDPIGGFSRRHTTLLLKPYTKGYSNNTLRKPLSVVSTEKEAMVFKIKEGQGLWNSEKTLLHGFSNK